MIYLGHWKALGTPPQIQLAGFAAIEKVFTGDVSTVLQLVALQSPFQDLGVDGNPLHNLRFLYAFGALTMDGKNMVRRGGVRWTVKDGVVFDNAFTVAIHGNLRNTFNGGEFGQYLFVHLAAQPIDRIDRACDHNEHDRRGVPFRFDDHQIFDSSWQLSRHPAHGFAHIVGGIGQIAARTELGPDAEIAFFR